MPRIDHIDMEIRFEKGGKEMNTDPIHSEWLDELEAELRRQEVFMARLLRWTALPHIIGSAHNELVRLRIAVKSEKRRLAERR